MAHSKTVVECLSSLGVTVECLQSCASVKEEFGVIKKCYFERALVSHPDKGGNADSFRLLQEGWEFIRELVDGGNVNEEGFRFYFSSGKDSKCVRSGRVEPVHSYEWFAAAAQVEVPAYSVEAAKSARSQCKVRMPSVASLY